MEKLSSMQFISGSENFCTRENHINAPILRKEFDFNSDCSNVILKIIATGFYRVFLNGKELTKGYYAPYISNPNDIVYYDEYDISENLQQRNVICFILGNGFVNAMDCNVWHFEESEFRSAPSVYASITSDDRIILSTDESFEAYDSAITFDSIRCGERYNACLYRPELFELSKGKIFENRKKAICVKPPIGEMRKCEAEPIREENTIKAKSFFRTDGGYIFDFGQNNAGIYRIKINGKEGQKLKLDFGEIVIDGKLDKRNLYFVNSVDEYTQHDEYVCRNGWQEWSPAFTYHGFQYVYIQGIEEEQVNENTIEYIIIHSDIKERGTFSCDNEIINRIVECALRSDKSNMFYFPTDCPHREKNGWTADASLSTEQFLYQLECENTLLEWMRNVCKAQKQSGMLPGIIPTKGWGYKWGNGPAWDSVIVEVPYQVYRFSGRLDAIENNIDTIINYFRFIKTQTNEKTGLVSFGLGDWCEADTLEFDKYTTPVEYTNALTLLDMTNKTLRMLCNYENKYKSYVREVKELRTILINSFRNNYIINNANVCKTQTACAMAIVVDGALKNDERIIVGNQLIALLEERQNRLKVGVVGVKYLFDALTIIGQTDRAIRVIVGPEFPSYGYLIENGATTLWEAFMKLSKSNRMEGENGRKFDSLNHHFWGSVVAWFYRVLAGLNLKDNGTIEINIPETTLINTASATWKLGHCFISVQWQKVNGEKIVMVDNNGFCGNIVCKDKKTALENGKNIYKI